MRYLHQRVWVITLDRRLVRLQVGDGMLLADAERVAGDGSVGKGGFAPLERRGAATVRADLARRRAGRKNEKIDRLAAEQSVDEVAPSLAGGGPPPPRRLSRVEVQMRHCVAAD